MYSNCKLSCHNRNPKSKKSTLSMPALAEPDHVLRFDAFISLTHSHLDSEQVHRIENILKRGLGDRLLALHLIESHHDGPATTSQRNTKPDNTTTTWGLTYSPSNIRRVVDHGPSATQIEECNEFRAFWGSKTALRRFKDGRVEEAVVWRAGQGCEPVWQQIAHYVLLRHVDITLAQSLRCSGPEYESLLCLDGLHSADYLSHYSRLDSAFTKLERAVSVTDLLPIGIRQLRPADARLRYASIDPGQQGARHSQSGILVVLQLDGSGKWPDDLTAINKTRTACNLRLAQWLRRRSPSIHTAPGYLFRTSVQESIPVLDVKIDGFTFRVDLHIEQHGAILERDIRLHTQVVHRKDQALLRLRDFRKNYIQQPLHSQAVRNHCIRNPVLSPAIRLMKLWISSHLLSDHLPSEIIEVLVIYVFLSFEASVRPSSPMAIFFQVLHFTSRWNWQADPILLFDEDGIESLEYELAQRRFYSSRRQDPYMRKGVIFMATKYDTDGYTWTARRPSIISVTRLISLADAAMHVLKKHQWHTELKSLFTPRYEDYDIIIHLRSTSLEHMADDLFSELEEAYSPLIMFFRDACSGTAILALFNPTVKAQLWMPRLRLPTSLRRANGAEIPMIDTESVIAEIGRLGGDLIVRVESCSL